MELPFVSFAVMEVRSSKICAGTAEGKTAKKIYADVFMSLWQLYDHSAGEELAT